MTMKKKIVTAMKTEVITDPDRIPGSIEQIGIWCRIDGQQGKIPDDVWDGPGEYLFNVKAKTWHRMKIIE